MMDVGESRFTAWGGRIVSAVGTRIWCDLLYADAYAWLVKVSVWS